MPRGSAEGNVLEARERGGESNSGILDDMRDHDAQPMRSQCGFVDHVDVESGYEFGVFALGKMVFCNPKIGLVALIES